MPEKSKLNAIILYALMGISFVLFVLFAISDEGSEAQSGYISILLTWCYVLGGIAILALLGFAVFAMLRNFGAAKTTLIGIGVLLAIFGLGWALSSGVAGKVGSMEISEAVSRRSEAGLITFYILMGIAVVSIIYTEISKAFK